MHPLIFAKRLFNKICNTNAHLSFSQSGEDLIVLFLINALKLQKVQYFDFGTNNPRNMSNTYLLYVNGFRGVCIEPDPSFHKAITNYRPEDTLIKAGVSMKSSESADFYIMDDRVLNTFSKDEAERMVLMHKRNIKETIKVPLISANEIFKLYRKEDHHTFLSLDIEGLDLEILKSIDLSLYAPSIICVETLEFSNNLSGDKNELIITYLLENNYKLYADTCINSIFIKKDLK